MAIHSAEIDTGQQSAQQAQSKLEECLTLLTPWSCVGLCFCGLPPLEAQAGGASGGRLARKGRLFSSESSLAFPDWVAKWIHNCFSKNAPQREEVMRSLRQSQPHRISPLSNLHPGLLNDHNVKELIHWPVSTQPELGWGASFILLFERPVTIEELNCGQLPQILDTYQRQLLSEYHQSFNPYSRRGVLNPTSIKVLKLLAEGFCTRQVAEKIHLSERGVDYHLDCLKQKLNARNRVHLIHVAHNIKLL